MLIFSLNVQNIQVFQMYYISNVKIAKLKMIIFVAIPANRLNKKNNRLQFNKSSAFAQLNMIHSSAALEYNTQVKSQHLYLEVYLQKASSIISNYHFMMRKSHSLKQQHRSLSEAQEISGAIVFFISLSPRSLLLSNEKLAVALGGRREEKYGDA